MSPFFSSPEFIAATHDDRARPPPAPGHSATTQPDAACSATATTADPDIAAEFSMQVQPIINAVQAALAGQGSLAGGDVAVEEAIDHLVSALAPGHPPGGHGSRRAGRVRGTGAAARPNGRPRPLRRRPIAAHRRSRQSPTEPNLVGGARRSYHLARPAVAEDASSKMPPRLRARRSTVGCSMRCRVGPASRTKVKGSARPTVSTCRKTDMSRN